MDWFPWYPERYRNKTLHLTAEQDGIYRRLIDHYMDTRKPLPDNNHALARISGVSIECFEHASSTIRAFFKKPTSGVLHHITCDEMLDEQDKLAKFRSERATKAALARHNKPNVINGNAATSKQQAMLSDATITVTETVKVVSKDTTLSPAWLPAVDWKDFCQMRGAKFTARAKQLVIGKLEKLKQEGHDPAAVLQQSLERGWSGVFPLKGDYNGSNQITPLQASGGNGGVAGEQNGNGFGGRKSQTQLAREITEKIKRDRRARWEANGGRNPDQEMPDQPGPAIGPIDPDLYDAEKIR